MTGRSPGTGRAGVQKACPACERGDGPFSLHHFDRDGCDQAALRSFGLETGSMYDIYAIVNTSTGRAYIGVAPAFEKRVRDHKSLLRIGRHPNAALQADWSERGEDGFRFVLIGESTKQYRHTIEGAYIAAWKYDTYNVVKNRASMNVLDEPVEIDYSRVPEPA